MGILHSKIFRDYHSVSRRLLQFYIKHYLVRAVHWELEWLFASLVFATLSLLIDQPLLHVFFGRFDIIVFERNLKHPYSWFINIYRRCYRLLGNFNYFIRHRNFAKNFVLEFTNIWI